MKNWVFLIKYDFNFILIIKCLKMNEARIKKMEAWLKWIVTSCLLQKSIEIQNDFWLINVNEIKIASDLSYLDIFVSSLKNGDKLCKALANYAQEIKEEINNNITLRKTPIVRFRYDSSIENSTDLINKINHLDIK
jgi:ribosome-binding factor A